MSEELKPCPFCGSGAHVSGGRVFGSGGFYVACDAVDCFAAVGEAYHHDEPQHCFHNEDVAIAAWNRRSSSGSLLGGDTK